MSGRSIRDTVVSVRASPPPPPLPPPPPQGISCAHSMWILENTTPNYGGGVEFGVPYRVRHLLSSAYLTVTQSAEEGGASQLTLSDQTWVATSRHSVFLLYPLDADAISLTPTTPVRLRHELSGLYIKRAMTEDDSKSVEVWPSSAQSPAPDLHPLFDNYPP